MNFANFIPAVLGILGLHEFKKVDGKSTLSQDEIDRLKAYNFSDAFLADFKKYIENPKPAATGEADAENRQAAAVAAVLGQTTRQLEAVTGELELLKSKTSEDAAAHAAAIEAKEKEIESLTAKVKVLSDMPEADPGQGAGHKGSAAPFNLNDTKQLGGFSGEFFSLDRAYNKRARAAMLAAQGYEVGAVAAPSSVDYQTLREDLGAFYRTRWQDRLQSFLVELPSIEDIFKLEAGHQDLDTLVNIFLGEFSQPDNSSESDFEKVTKGTYELGDETLRMYDVMFAHKFTSMKKLEKSWIAYLNREGSSPVKLSFIEYLLVETAKALHNEKQLRYVNGVRKDPDINVPGKAMEAADGIYEYLRKRVEGYTDFTPNGGTTGKTVYQIKPFELPEITPGNIGEVFYLGTQMIPSVFRDKGIVELYVPSYMMPWYHKYNETHYGQNLDYKSGINYVKEFPSVKIVAIPNADNHCRIFWTLAGNVQTFCFIAGEMLRFNLEQVDWSVKVWSNWKESIQAIAVGMKYTNPLEMDGSRQLIWCNNYDRPASYYMEAGRDQNPSVLLHTSVVTAANSSVFEITDIKDAKVGQIVKVKCGADGDNGVTIKKAKKFAQISANWTPKKGDVISLMLNAEGNFIEISRASAAADSYQIDPDATEPSVQGADTFIVGVNTKATAITNLADAVPGVVYTIYGAGIANASTIANGGNFVLKAAMTLKEGSFIKLVKAADGKFYEVARG